MRLRRSCSKKPKEVPSSPASTWGDHLVPLSGTLKLEQVTPDTVREIRWRSPSGSRRGFPTRYRGQTVANRSAQQADTAWNFALRMEWVSRNPWSGRIVRRYEEEPDEHLLTAEDYAALGRALREAEAALGRPRPPLPMPNIAAIRVLLVTGARPGEITPAAISPGFAWVRWFGVPLLRPGRSLPHHPSAPGRGRPTSHQASAREADLPSHGGRRDDSRGATLGWQHPCLSRRSSRRAHPPARKGLAGC
jgi:integrase